MKAVIGGVTVEGTPEEIAAYVKLHGKAKSLAERVVPQRPSGHLPRRIFDPTSRESQEAAKKLQELLEQTPNVNITPIAQFCDGHRRYC